MGAAYLRYSFTKGTAQEVDFLTEALGLRPGERVLDVGCGPGRHARALAERGVEVVGVDLSDRFVALAREGAPPGATFHVADARSLTFDGEFDAAICLCQGGFGLLGGGDDEAAVLAGIARALKPGRPLAASAFSAYFQVRFLEETDDFDAASGVNRETSTVKSEDGSGEAEFAFATTCFTPRELRLMAAAAGLTVDHLYSVAPGNYAARPPDLDHPELLLLAHRT
jgi:SAM-dependent methyltransferase